MFSRIFKSCMECGIVVRCGGFLYSVRCLKKIGFCLLNISIYYYGDVKKVLYFLTIVILFFFFKVFFIRFRKSYIYFSRKGIIKFILFYLAFEFF